MLPYATFLAHPSVMVHKLHKLHNTGSIDAAAHLRREVEVGERQLALGEGQRGARLRLRLQLRLLSRRARPATAQPTL